MKEKPPRNILNRVWNLISRVEKQFSTTTHLATLSPLRHISRTDDSRPSEKFNLSQQHRISKLQSQCNLFKYFTTSGLSYSVSSSNSFSNHGNEWHSSSFTSLRHSVQCIIYNLIRWPDIRSMTKHCDHAGISLKVNAMLFWIVLTEKSSKIILT